MTRLPRLPSTMVLRSAATIMCGCLLSWSPGTAPAVAQPAPAAAQTRPATSGEVAAKLDQVVREFQKDPRFKGQSEQQVRERIEFIAGNVIFATVHEMGHMLITELGLPVLGREEDAADSFAVLTGLKLGGPLSDRVLTQSARGWFMSDRRAKKEKVKMVFYDEHGLDSQRAYNIVCLMVGSNPQKFDDLASVTKLPEERRGTCQGDYSNASWSWEKVLTPHIRKADQPKIAVEVKYAETSKYQVFAKGFQEIRLLETFAEHISDRFVLRGPIGIEMTTCNEPGAHWDLSIRKIIVCYELAVDFGDLYRGYAVEPKPQRTKAARKR